jgi:hypothetical protein
MGKKNPSSAQKPKTKKKQAQAKQTHANKHEQQSEAAPNSEASIPPDITFSSGQVQAQISTLQRLPKAQRQEMIGEIARTQGNRQVSKVMNMLQRHPGHGDAPPQTSLEEEAVPSGGGEVMRQPMNPQAPALIMRSELTGDATELHKVKLVTLPLKDGTGAAAATLGALSKGNRVRILKKSGATHAKVHVETGALKGEKGFVELAGTVKEADPTSQSAGTDAYQWLKDELAKPKPDAGQIFDTFSAWMTADQKQRLLRSPEYAQIKALASISAEQLLRMLNVAGSPLLFKVKEYLDKGGRQVKPLRLAFATAGDGARLEVAKDEATVGRLRAILGTVHPEIIFGPGVLIGLYPGESTVEKLAETRPELASWLKRHTKKDESIIMNAIGKMFGLASALYAIKKDGAAASKKEVIAAVDAAPRGLALPQHERVVLDQIEEVAYADGAYKSYDLGKMFVTRWGRPFKGASGRTKSFLHQVWKALKQLPEEHVMKVNVLSYFEENLDPKSAGSFTDWLGGSNFGALKLDKSEASAPLHAASDQNAKTIEVDEPHIDLIKPRTKVEVTESDGVKTVATVKSVSVPSKRLTLSKKVNVSKGGPIVGTTGTSDADRGEAVRIKSPTPLYKDNAGVIDKSTVLATLQPGIIFSRVNDHTEGAEKYYGGEVSEGDNRRAEGWIKASSVTSLGATMKEIDFGHTVRHEMGHALDLQIGGFSRFSAPSAAKWKKYNGAGNWIDDLIAKGGIADPTKEEERTLEKEYEVKGVVKKKTHKMTHSFKTAATTYIQAVQAGKAGSTEAMKARHWLEHWSTHGGTEDVYNTVTQFNASPSYYVRNSKGVPAIGGRIFGAHYSEYFSADDSARSDSLSVGISGYGYTCSYEFFAEHYAAYTSPGTPPDRYARAVPKWAQNFFDRLVGVGDAGPRVGMKTKRMSP